MTENAAQNQEGEMNKPRGIKISLADINAVATGDDILQVLDEEIIRHKRQVQNNKQMLSMLHRKAREHDLPALEVNKPEDAVSARWTNQELQLGVQGIRQCGRDFDTIASILGTKTAQHVETFYNTYRISFDLDKLCKEGEVVNIC